MKRSESKSSQRAGILKIYSNDSVQGTVFTTFCALSSPSTTMSGSDGPTRVSSRSSLGIGGSAKSCSSTSAPSAVDADDVFFGRRTSCSSRVAIKSEQHPMTKIVLGYVPTVFMNVKPYTAGPKTWEL